MLSNNTTNITKLTRRKRNLETPREGKNKKTN